MSDIVIDGSLSDWSSTQRIDGNALLGYQVYATADVTDYIFALSAPQTITPGSTIWLNTDLNQSTGFQIFNFTGGAEFHITIKADGSAGLYGGADGQTLVADNLLLAYNADYTTVEVRVSKAVIGSPMAVDTLYDIVSPDLAEHFIPTSYDNNAIRVWDDSAVANVTPATDTRIAIVYSATTAANYFNKTAYSDLFMAAQSQAAQAGVSFDILTEADLTSIEKLAQYKAIVFPSFRNVQASQADQIAHTLQIASQTFHVGLVVSGEFMTNDEHNLAMPGNSYARMASLLDVTRVDGGTGDVTIHATDPTGVVLNGYANGELVNEYSGVGWNAFTSVSGTGQTIATETINGTTDYAAVLATQTGGRNVVFASDGVMADGNMLQKAISYAVNGSGVSVALHMTRDAGLVAARVDMDQSMYTSEVSPTDGPGIYDQLLPLLENWKAQYNFVGSYYVNIGNDPEQGITTDWTKSLPYYTALIKMGNEIGTHSYTHPEDTNGLTDAQLAFEFGQSTTELEQQLSTALGYAYHITGAAIPGAPETLTTSLAIEKYVSTYLSGGYTGQGSGYPNAFGYLTPDSQDKVYLAPNTYFDFTLFDWLHLDGTQASALLEAQYSQITSHGDTPVVVWPWHDYGATGFNAPNYSTQMWNTFIAKAAADNMEFVTLGDLSDRINAFHAATVTTSVSGNVITATVTAGDVGEFALDFNGLGSQIIQNVAGWYAYDSDSVFLPKAGGTFTVTLGAVQDDVTHIIDLPMRATLLTLTGDGRNLSFDVEGEGRVTIDLADPTGKVVSVTGATVVSQTGDKLTIDIGAVGTHSVTITQTTPNTAPAITSNGGGDSAAISIAENATAVTTVTSSDTDGPTATYSISGGADADKFTIDALSGALTFVSAPNFEAPTDAGVNNVYDVVVAVSDGSLTDTQALAVTVTNVNEAPVLSSNGGGETATITVAENGTAVTSVKAADPEGTALTYSIQGGADAARFVINAATGALSFVAAPNFELPTDAGANNVYDVIVGASDGTLVDTQAIAVTVGNVNEAPVITSNGGGASASMSLAENTTAVTTVTSTDPDGPARTYSVSGTDAAFFTIDPVTGALRFTNAPDYENPTDSGANNVYNVVVTASDGSLADTQALAITVQNRKGINFNAPNTGGTFSGTGEEDTLDGGRGVDILYGLGGNDTLTGAGGNDKLYGGDGSDVLNGGAGTDILYGGTGADVFRFPNVTDSVVGAAHDLIADFEVGIDRIGLAGIDANTSRGGNQTFVLLAEGAQFTGAGQLRFFYDSLTDTTILQGNVNNNLAADFEIALSGHLALATAGTFVL